MHPTKRRAEIHLAPGPGAARAALGGREKAGGRLGASRGFADLISLTFPTGSSQASHLHISSYSQLQPERRALPASKPFPRSPWKTSQLRQPRGMAPTSQDPGLPLPLCRAAEAASLPLSRRWLFTGKANLPLPGDMTPPELQQSYTNVGFARWPTTPPARL